MIFHRLGVINKDQKGFGLVELIVALAITGLITGGITMSIFQVFDINTRSNNHMTAVRQVQNAGYWISHDTQMAQIVELEWQGETPVGSKFPLKLTWTDWDGTEHQVIYTLENMTGEAKQLKRSHSVNGGEPSETIVAQYLVPGLALTHLDFNGGKLTLMITATVGGGWKEASETRVYEVIPRPGS